MHICDFTTDGFKYAPSYDCDCGTHVLTTTVYDDVSRIAELYPKGSVAAAVCGGDISYLISVFGKKGIKLRQVKTETTEEGVKRISFDSDVRFIISCGGESEADCAKRLGKLRGLPVFIAVCSPNAVTVLDGYCALWDNGALVLKQGAVPVGAALVPPVITSSKELPAALGGIGAVASVLYDGEAYARAVGEFRCPHVREAALDLIYSAFDMAAKYRRGSGELNLRLAEIALRIAFLAQAEKGDFVRGAADCCARAAITLYKRERREAVSRSEFAFIFSTVLGGIYSLFDLPAYFLPPPDNNLRAELLSEYFGLDKFTAASAAVTRTVEPKLAAYRISEYNAELGDISAECKRVYAVGWRLFKRSYPDDGFFLSKLLDSSDIKTVIALSPDLFPVRGNALTLMRDFGALERLL